MVKAGSIARGTFGLIRANPVSIAIWSGLHVFAGLAMMAILQPFYAARLEAARTGVMPSIFGGGFFVALLLMILLFTILWAAAFRAATQPGERHAAYLRVGMDELRLIGVSLILTIGFYLVMFVLGLVVGVLAGLVGAAAGGGSRTVLALVIIASIALLCAAAIYFGVRLSPAGPLTIIRRKIIIGDAWRLTRGHFWRLLGGYVLVGLVVFAVYIVILAIQLGPMLAAAGSLTSPGAAQRIALWQAEYYGQGFGTHLLLNALIGGLTGGVLLALQAGTIGIVTTQLLAERETDPVANPVY